MFITVMIGKMPVVVTKLIQNMLWNILEMNKKKSQFAFYIYFILNQSKQTTMSDDAIKLYFFFISNSRNIQIGKKDAAVLLSPFA